LPPLSILLLLLQPSLLFQSPALIIVPTLRIAAPLICLTTLPFRLATLLFQQTLLRLLLLVLLPPRIPLALGFSLPFLIEAAAVFLFSL